MCIKLQGFNNVDDKKKGRCGEACNVITQNMKEKVQKHHVMKDNEFTNKFIMKYQRRINDNSLFRL
jgi:hypothetical protein